MLPSGDNASDPNDEEAQLLTAEEIELEEDGQVSPPVNARRPSGPFSRLRRWVLAPQPPRIQRVDPWLPGLQQLPLDVLRHIAPDKTRKSWLLVVFIAVWAAAFSGPLVLNSLPAKDGLGRDVVNLDCVDTLWARKNECGLDGIDCEPFSNASFTFRCPANCAGVKVWNPHAVGALDVAFRPLVVGDMVYRGDSFICGSAVHAGVISDSKGGCGKLSRIGQTDGFPSVDRNGIESIPFDSHFPLSFTFLSDDNLKCGGQDPRFLLLFVSLFFTAGFSICTTSPAWQFFVQFTAVFFHVSFVSDPPGASFHNLTVLPDHASRFAERFLPAAFCAVIIYKAWVKRTLVGLRAQLEKTILWLGGFWFGALSNYTFDWIPLQRLTAHDIGRQPGALAALIGIVAVLVIIVLQQAYYFRLEGRLHRLLALYGIFFLAIAIGANIPSLQLRLHHYIIALLLLPGTSMQTRPSLLYQGILLGLFVNGVARWGFDSVLQTAGDLRGDGAFESLVPPGPDPVIKMAGGQQSIAFIWQSPSGPFDGVSALVNDVERYRQFFVVDDFNRRNFTWLRSASAGLPEYFRFAYLKEGVTLDYTPAGTWFPNGTWQAMEIDGVH